VRADLRRGVGEKKKKAKSKHPIKEGEKE